MREGLILDVDATIDNELVHSYDKFPAFASAHEGYAVIKEKLEEVLDEWKRSSNLLSEVWTQIKNNTDATELVKKLAEYARLLTYEAAQTAAMAEKYIESSKGWEK